MSSQALDQWVSFSTSAFQFVLVQIGYQHKPAYINPNAWPGGLVKCIIRRAATIFHASQGILP